MNENVERARAVWKICRLCQGIHHPEFCAALKKSPLAIDLRVVPVPMETLVSPEEGTVYGCVYAVTLDRFIGLVRDDIPLDHQDLVVYHEADHVILGDVVPDFPGDPQKHLCLRVQWRDDGIMTPQEVAADEFAREIHRLAVFGIDEAPSAVEMLSRAAVEATSPPGRVQAFHNWVRHGRR